MWYETPRVSYPLYLVPWRQLFFRNNKNVYIYFKMLMKIHKKDVISSRWSFWSSSAADHIVLWMVARIHSDTLRVDRNCGNKVTTNSWKVFHAHWRCAHIAHNSGICMNIALRRFLHNHGNIETEGSPKPGLCPTLIWMTSRILYSAQYHRLQAPVDTNEPSGPASYNSGNTIIF